MEREREMRGEYAFVCRSTNNTFDLFFILNHPIMLLVLVVVLNFRTHAGTTFVFCEFQNKILRKGHRGVEKRIKILFFFSFKAIKMKKKFN